MRTLATSPIVIVALALGCSSSGGAKEKDKEKPVEKSGGDAAASRAAFMAVYPVFMHPRCVNCHPAGDAPLQGDDSHVHGQNVKRGADGRGVFALKCASCHMDANVPGEHMPPGNPSWRLPPADAPMIFQGRSARELAAQLIDPKQNGGKKLDDLVRHMSEDSLVANAWSAGTGRAPPPLGHDETAKRFREWIEKGAFVPE